MSAKQILVVEDERPIREMIAFGLRRAGFEVREAADARSGRAEVANKLPDLLPRASEILALARSAVAGGRILDPAEALPVYVRDNVAVSSL